MRTALGLFTMALIAGGSATTHQPDGSTRVSVTVSDKLGLQPRSAAKAPSSTNEAAGAADGARASWAAPDTGTTGDVPSAAFAAPSVSETKLAGVFERHRYDGAPNAHFPRVAVTVTDWSRNNCWIATATIWWSKSKSEAVPAFSVCWGKSVGYAVNNAVNLRLLMQQTAVEHSGNVRTDGPKPPMLAIPDRQPIRDQQQLAFQGFIQQLVLDTGWQPGAPTNLWLVGYDANATAKSTLPPASNNGSPKPVGVKTKAQLEQALSCTAMSPRFELAESLLKQSGWSSAQGVTPVTLAEPVKVYGISVRKVAVSRDGGEQTYRSYLPGLTVQKLAKAASLKLGRDSKTYGRLTKVGVLSAGMEGSEATLTCTVDSEASEG